MMTAIRKPEFSQLDK